MMLCQMCVCVCVCVKYRCFGLRSRVVTVGIKALGLDPEDHCVVVVNFRMVCTRQGT